MFVIKNNLVQKTPKKWWPVTFGTVSVLIARKNTGACYISALLCDTVTQHLVVTVVHNSVGSHTKSMRPRLRSRPKLQDQDQDQDRGRSETGLVTAADPKDCCQQRKRRTIVLRSRTYCFTTLYLQSSVSRLTSLFSDANSKITCFVLLLFRNFHPSLIWLL